MKGNGNLSLDRISRLYRQVTGRGLTREDLFGVLDRAQRQGLFEQDTLDTIERVVQVSELRVRDIMIPRARMVVIDRTKTPEEILPQIIGSAHSRFPVVDTDRDRVIGVLLAKDLLRYYHDPADDALIMKVSGSPDLGLAPEREN